MSRKKTLPPDVSDRLSTPFAGLGSLRDVLPPGRVPATASPPPPGSPPRAVVRYERKGRGGKEATVIEHLELSAPERSAWLQALKQALGCGGTVEGEALVLQGDQRARARAWLAARGVARISVG